MKLTDIHEIRALLTRHGFHFSKALGQNFLCVDWVPVRTAELAGLDETTGVLEVGPGVGCLTVELARRAKRVLSVELDRALRPVLAETLAGLDNVELCFGDVLKHNLNELIAAQLSDCDRVAVCANLPYNITSPVLTAFTECRAIESVTVLIQREVARRICARENTADYGAFTVLMQWHWQTEPGFDVAPGCFIPAPKVTSSVIRLTRRAEPPCAVRDEAAMFRLVRAAFNQRRKTLVNAMTHGLSLSRERAAAALSRCGLPETVRGEALSVAQFAALSDALGAF